MSRALDAEILAAIAEGVVYPFFTVDLMFETGSVTYGDTTVESQPVYFWSGNGVATIDGTDYIGTGQFLEISRFDETAEIAARNATLTLSGVPGDLLALALQTQYQGRKCIIKFGVYVTEILEGSLLMEAGTYILKEDDGQIVLEPAEGGEIPGTRSTLFSGYMDQMSIAEGADTSQIALSVESRLVDMERPRVRRYTDESQRSRFPSDKGFAFVNGLQDKELFWGRR